MVEPDDSAFDADRPVFASDVRCSTCGYNLRGLPLDGFCPECGTRIAQTADARSERKRAAIDAEIEEALREQAEQHAHREAIARMLAAWNEQGERFDRLLERLSQALDRYEAHETGEAGKNPVD